MEKVYQENLYFEILDRQSRTRNIILFNAPEHTNSPSQTKDISILKDVFHTIGIQANPVSINRLG